MEVHQDQSLLRWKDLSAEDVYYTAHVENEMRDNAAALLSKIAFITDATVLAEAYQQAHTIIKDCDTNSNNWISSLAISRGYASAEKSETKLPGLQNPESSSANRHITNETNEWIASQLDLARSRGISAKDIAQATGISESYLSGLKNGRRGRPSDDVRQKLSNAFSELI